MQLKALFVLGAAAAASASASSVIVDDSAQPLLSEDIVSSVNSNPHSTWKASMEGTSRFDGLTLEQARSIFGAKTDLIENLPKISHSAEALASVPS